VRVVFDTNVIVAGIVAQGVCREILETHLPAHIAVVSQPMWRELEDVLSGKLDLDPETLPVLRLYHRHATWVEAEALAEPVCRDPDDDMVLATAIAGEADVMVTGDEDLLVLGSHAGISILSPRQFLMAQ